MTESPTPRPDSIRNTPLMGETVPEHKWDKMTEHARRRERDRAELIAMLDQAQRLRPAMLMRDNVVPSCVLDYCNEVRALLAKMQVKRGDKHD